MQEHIKRYYENYDEDGRLFRDNAHMPEYLTTIRYFDRLFTPGMKILDACAGAGRYSFYLADKGCIVTACDLVEHNVGIIKSKPKADKLAEISACDSLDLSRFKESSFDAVLCMGALYHLRTNGLREKAILECLRICKPGGIVVLAYLTKIGAIHAQINADASNMDELLKILDDTDEGIFFCTSPQEIEMMTLRHGIEKKYNIGTDGMIYAVASKLNEADDSSFQKYMEYHYKTCEDESILGASLHGLWIGRKE